MKIYSVSETFGLTIRAKDAGEDVRVEKLCGDFLINELLRQLRTKAKTQYSEESDLYLT